MSVCMYSRFQVINRVNVNEFSPNLVCALTICIDIVKICLGLLMGKFHDFLTVICPPHYSGRVLLFHFICILNNLEN